MQFLDKETLEKAFHLLGELAEERGIELEICVYGGSAMLLAYGSRKATKDVDATLNPRKEGKQLAAIVGKRLGLHEDWLNEDVRQFLGPDSREGRRKLDLKIPGLKTFIVTANYLLAMKAIACRRPLPGYRGDQEDLLFLIRKLEINSIDDIQKRLDRFFPDEIIREENHQVLQSLIKEAHHDGG